MQSAEKANFAPSRAVKILVIAFPLLTTISRAYTRLRWSDALELIPMANTLGIPHPPGYPLYILINKLFLSFCHPSQAALMANMLSGIFSAISIYVLYHISMQIYKSEQILINNNGYLQNSLQLKDELAKITAFSGALCVAFSSYVWQASLETEVYTLHCLFVSLILLTGSLLYNTKNKNIISLLVFLFSFALTTHHTGIFLSPFVIIIIATIKPTFKDIIKSVSLFILGLSIYLYLPIRAFAKPALNWGQPDSLLRFLWVVRGGDFKGNLALYRLLPQYINKTLFLLFQHINNSYGYLYILGFFGIIYLLSKRFLLGICFLTTFFGYSLFAVCYRVPDTQAFFYIPNFLWGVFICSGLQFICYLVYAKISKIYLILLCIGITLLPLILYLRSEKTYMPYNTPEYFSGSVMSTLPENAIIVVYSDYESNPLWYQQYVYGYRKDVVVLAANFLASPWYKNFLPEYLLRQIKIKKTRYPTREAWLNDLFLNVLKPLMQKGGDLYCLALPTELSDRIDIQPKIEAAIDIDCVEEWQKAYLPTGYLFKMTIK